MFFWGHGTLLVNAYVSYKRFMENKGLQPMSHYKFRRAIVLAKICPTRYGAKKQQGTIASQRGDQRSVASSSKGHSKRSSESVASATRAAKKQKVEKQEYASTKRVVDDTSDFNRARLDLSFPHLPEPVDNEKRGKCCQLCRYASGKKYSTNISSCSHCNVTLCVWCFKPFHTLPSISAAKNDICAGINKRKGAKKEKAASKKGKGNFRNIK